MAEHNYHQATLQHLAHLRQDLVPRQGASVLQHQQVALAEVALEAHLQRQHRAQVLQRQQVGGQHQ